MDWDPQGTARLESIRDALTRIGLVAFVRDEVATVWTANRDRHEPEELFDDSWTLASQSSRNLANRVFAHLQDDRKWRSAGVSASREHNATVLHLLGLDVRMVKAPVRAGRRPGFTSDFEWSSGARLDAATRNHALYPAPARQAGMDALFEIDRTDEAHPVLACRDLFVVWAGDPDSGLTAGWLGLPTTTPDRWIAVIPVWWDEASRDSASTGDPDTQPARGLSFGASATPIPVVTLKSQSEEGTAR